MWDSSRGRTGLKGPRHLERLGLINGVVPLIVLSALAWHVKQRPNDRRMFTCEEKSRLERLVEDTIVGNGVGDLRLDTIWIHAPGKELYRGKRSRSLLPCVIIESDRSVAERINLAGRNKIFDDRVDPDNPFRAADPDWVAGLPSLRLRTFGSTFLRDRVTTPPSSKLPTPVENSHA